jgi:hypothetical protein
VEQDEAGRLRAFRQRFGRGWDLDSQDGEDSERLDGDVTAGRPGEEGLMDLISGASGGIAYNEKGVGTEAEEGDVGEGIEMIKVMRDGKLVSVPVQNKKDRRK